MAIAFHKNNRSGAWELVGPAAELAVGEVVTVARRDGSTARKRVVSTSRPWDRDGTPHVFATFEDAPARVEAAPAPKAKAPAKRARRSAFVPCGYPGCGPGYCDECSGEGMYPSRSRSGGDAAPF